MRLGASVRNRPGCGKSITSGGLPPWISTGAWTSNWSVPWKSIVTPVHSTSGSHQLVKRPMASGSFSLLRTGERTVTVLPSCCWSHGISVPSSDSAAAGAVGGLGAVGRFRAVGRFGAVGRLGPGGRLGLRWRLGPGGCFGPRRLRGDGARPSSSSSSPQATSTNDVMAASAATRLPYLMLELPREWHAPGRMSAPASWRRTGPSTLAMRLEMMWNRMEDSEGYPSSRCVRGEDAIVENRRRQLTSREGVRSGQHRAQGDRQGLRERVPRRAEALARGGRRRVPGARRPVGMWEVDRAAHDRRAGDDLVG